MGDAGANLRARGPLDASVRLTERAKDLVRRIGRDYDRLFILLDDTGCCGPGNVFLQKERPGEPYVTVGTAEGLEIRIHPSFHGDRRGEEFVIDAHVAAMDDSFSLETRYGYRFILHLDRRAVRREREREPSPRA